MKPTEHDLRAPLAAIEGYARLLLESISEEKPRNQVEGILSSCRILEHLVANMRLADALAAGRIESVEPGGRLGDILDRVAGGFRRAYEAKRARICASADEIRLNRGAALVERFLANLLLAALNTSFEGRDVGLRATHGSGEFTFSLEAAGLSGRGPGQCLDLIAEVSARLGGRGQNVDGGYRITIPESVLMEPER